jgi:uroporphyrinogen-III synthase
VGTETLSPTEGGPVPRTAAVSPPLAGTRVVVTRARAQASRLAERLTDLGAEVVELAVIAIDDPVDGGVALAAAMDRVTEGAYAWVVITSTNAVVRAVDALSGRAVPASTRWAAVGASTARALEERGVDPDLVPEVAISDALVDAFPVAPPPAAGAVGSPAPATGEGTVLFVRAERVRDVVAPGLAAKGWMVDEVVAYRTVAGAVDDAVVEEARSCDAVAFTSSSTVERTVDLLGVAGVPPVVMSIGPVTSGSARAAGLVVTGEATEHTLDGLVSVLVAALGSGPGEDRRPSAAGQERPAPSA